MPYLRTIRIVAAAEARIFARSWIFRFFTVITVIILGFINWGLYIPKAQGSVWMLRSINSSIPYFNFLFLAVVESLIVIFGAIDSIHRDYKLDTTESLHARNYANLSYMTGKAIGIMIPCLILNLLVGLLAFVVNLVFVSDVPVAWTAYVIYPLLLSIPALMFMTSLSLAVMSLLRSKPLSMLLLGGFFIFTFVFNEGIFAKLIDVAGIHLPFHSSSFVGLENIRSVLSQRGFFIFASLACIIMSAYFLKRLPQSLKLRKASLSFIAVFAAAAIFSGVLFTGKMYNGIMLRATIRNLNEQFIGNPRAKVTACDLDIKHHGSTFDVTATLKILNPNMNPMASVFFSLNPGFAVESVETGGTELTFIRDIQILDITLNSPLMPDEETVFTVTYSGTVNDGACYPDIVDEELLRPNRLFTYVINKRYGFITPDYILLTPECQWYPVSGIPFGLVFPAAYERDFIDFTVDISTGVGMTVVSQGAVNKTGDGQFSIKPETKLNGLTLAVGEYEKKAVDIDGVELAIYHKPGHDYFSKIFNVDIKNIIEPIERLKLDYDNNKGMKYPFPRYSVVETPIQFAAYERPWSTYMETSQPQMSFVPEKGYFMMDLDIAGKWAATQSMYSRSGREITEEQYVARIMQGLFILFMSDGAQRNATRRIRSQSSSRLSFVEMIGRILMNVYQSSYRPSHTLSAHYYPFYISFESEKYPVFNTIMEFYRKHGLNTNMQMDYNRMQYPLLDEEIACMALERGTFANFLENESDFDTMNMLLMLKANHLFGQLQTEAGTDDFVKFVDEFIKEHPFQSVKYEEFAEAVGEKYGVDMDALFETWYNENRMPKFTINDIKLTEILEGNYTSYQTTFKITNSEPVAGTVWIQLQQSGTTQITQTRATRFIKLEGHQSKEIGVITEAAPQYIGVNTMISQNIPIMFTKYFAKPDVDHSMEPFEGERIVEYSPPVPEPGTIVVDNLDEGFEIISEPKETSKDRYASIYRFGQFPDGYISCVPAMPPQRWGKAVFESAYGSKETAVYTRCGDGVGCVAWNVDMTEQGKYDLEFYIADFSRSMPMRFPDDPLEGKPLFGEYNLTVHYGNQDNNVTFIPDENQQGWQYVSSFDLGPGKTTVELSNKSKGKLVYADAIRWVRRD